VDRLADARHVWRSREWQAMAEVDLLDDPCVFDRRFVAGL